MMAILNNTHGRSHNFWQGRAKFSCVAKYTICLKKHLKDTIFLKISQKHTLCPGKDGLIISPYCTLLWMPIKIQDKFRCFFGSITSVYFDCIIEQVVNIYRFWWCQNVVTKMSANVRMEVNVVEESAFGLDFINILRPNFSFVWVFDAHPPTRKSRIFLLRCWNLFKFGNIGCNFFSLKILKAFINIEEVNTTH